VGVRLARRIVNLRLRLESTVTLRAMLQSDHIFIYDIQPRPPADLHRYEITCTGTICTDLDAYEVMGGRQAAYSFSVGSGDPLTSPQQPCPRRWTSATIFLALNGCNGLWVRMKVDALLDYRFHKRYSVSEVLRGLENGILGSEFTG